MAIDLSIIIVNWNTFEYLQGCLGSIIIHLHNSSKLSTEIIVVDNASYDRSVEMVKSDFPQVKLIQNSENYGFAKANNQAIRISTGSRVLFLNPDTLVNPVTISAIDRFLTQNPKVGIVAPKILNDDGSIQISAFRFPTLFNEFWRLFKLDFLYPMSTYPKRYFNHEKPKRADVVLGACFLVKRECLEQIGLLDEQFFVYSEEVDFCYRAHKAGWETYLLPQATIIHFGGKSTEKVSDAMFVELNRNKTRYFRKHHGEMVAQLYKALLVLISFVRIGVSRLMRLPGLSSRLLCPDLEHKYRLLLNNLGDF